MPPVTRGSTTRRLNELLSTSQNKSYFVGAVTVVFIVIMTMVGILPAYSAFTFQNEENAKRDILIEKLQKKLQISQELSTEYENKSALVSYFNEVFPETAKQQDIIKLLNDIVTNNSSFLNRISFSKSPSTGFAQLGYDSQVKAQITNITVEGSQSSVLNIVSDIENSRRILNIVSVTIDRKPQDVIDSGSVTNGEYVLNAQIEYYYFAKAGEEETL